MIVIAAVTWSAFSCGVISSLNSNTSIKPHDRFVLGQNPQGKFKTHLKNEGVTVLKVFQAPIEGGSHSPTWSIRKKPCRLKLTKTRRWSLRIQVMNMRRLP